MSHPEVLLLGILLACVDVALWSLLGQGLVALLAGARRQGNPVYQLFSIISRPPIKAVRLITPRIILDAHIPLVTFFLLFWLRLALAYAKQQICLAQSLAC
jgi:hypothetical protein